MVVPRAAHVDPELLQAACLAGTLRVPLFVLRDGDDPIKGLKELLAGHGVAEMVAKYGGRCGLGAACKKLGDVRARFHRTGRCGGGRGGGNESELTRDGKIETLVLANPADAKGKHSGSRHGSR